MARDAIARLYDVDDTSVIYKRPRIRGKYDHGTITFRARKGKLVDLDKLHESAWATRLSGGTRSGLLRLDVTLVGKIAVNGKTLTMTIPGSDGTFRLVADPEVKIGKDGKTPLQGLRESLQRGDVDVRVTGRVAGWQGRWPTVLRTMPAKPRTIQVTSFQASQ